MSKKIPSSSRLITEGRAKGTPPVPAHKPTLIHDKSAGRMGASKPTPPVSSTPVQPTKK